MNGFKLGEAMQGGKVKLGSATYDIVEVRMKQGLVWPTDYTYTVLNISIHYSTGSMIAASGLNYAYLTGDVRRVRGTETETLYNQPLTPVFDATQSVFSIDAQGHITAQSRGTIIGDLLSASLHGTYQGESSPSSVTVSQQANSLERTDITNVEMTMDILPGTLGCDQTSAEVTAWIDRTLLHTYTSTATQTVTDHEGTMTLGVDGYQYDITHNHQIDVTVDDNKHSLDDRDVYFELSYGDYSINETITQEADTTYTSKEYRTPVFNVSLYESDVDATGGQAEYSITSYHEERTNVYWASDRTIKETGTWGYVDDGYTVEVTGATNYFRQHSKTDSAYVVEHDNMGKRVTTDSATVRFTSDWDTTKTWSDTLSATNRLIRTDEHIGFSEGIDAYRNPDDKWFYNHYEGGVYSDPITPELYQIYNSIGYSSEGVWFQYESYASQSEMAFWYIGSSRYPGDNIPAVIGTGQEHPTTVLAQCWKETVYDSGSYPEAIPFRVTKQGTEDDTPTEVFSNTHYNQVQAQLNNNGTGYDRTIYLHIEVDGVVRATWSKVQDTVPAVLQRWTSSPINIVATATSFSIEFEAHILDEPNLSDIHIEISQVNPFNVTLDRMEVARVGFLYHWGAIAHFTCNASEITSSASITLLIHYFDKTIDYVVNQAAATYSLTPVQPATTAFTIGYDSTSFSVTFTAKLGDKSVLPSQISAVTGGYITSLNRIEYIQQADYFVAYFNCAANPDAASRGAIFTLSCGNETLEYNVTQEANPSPSTDTHEDTYPVVSGNYNFTIKNTGNRTVYYNYTIVYYPKASPSTAYTKTGTSVPVVAGQSTVVDNTLSSTTYGVRLFIVTVPTQ